MSKLKVNELDTESGTTITVTAGKTLAGTDIIGSTQIAANAVTLAEMAGLARGKLIVGDASGDPAALAVGTNNYVLTSDGTDIAWEAAAGGLPTQNAAAAGKKLMTDGTNASWEPSPGRNYIRNGQFDIWQRGTTITNGSNLAMGYSADGWRDEGYAWTGNVTRQTFTNAQTVVPDNPTYFLRWIVTANPSGFNALVQRIENNPVNRLSGKTIVVSFWIRSVSGTLADGVIKMYGKAALVGSGTDNIGAVTTTWTKITVTGTLGTITATSWTTGLTTDQLTTFSSGVDMANWQVEIGDTPTAFDQKTFGQELAVSQRYYEKSYDVATDPATATASSATFVRHPTAGPGAFFITYKVPKRAIPTTVSYSRAAGTSGKATNMSGGASDITASFISGGRNSTVVYWTSTGSETYVESHWTASAEL